MRYLRGGLIVLAATLVLAPAAGAFVSKTNSGHRVGLMLRAKAAQAHLAATKGKTNGKPTSGVVQYHGGPVLHSETAYPIFWEPGGTHVISANSKAVLTQYLTDAANDSGQANNVFGVLTQYTDTTGSGALYAQATPRVIDDTQPYPDPNEQLLTGARDDRLRHRCPAPGGDFPSDRGRSSPDRHGRERADLFHDHANRRQRVHQRRAVREQQFLRLPRLLQQRRRVRSVRVCAVRGLGQWVDQGLPG